MADCNQCPSEIWLTAGFRCARAEEKWIFMKKECALYCYNDGKKDEIERSPSPIGTVFPTLKCTIFADAGIDCAFATSNTSQAYIFSYNQCALFDYAPFGGDDCIVKGPMPIATMFPFLKNTDFENGIDAAFDSINRQEAYLFKGNKCARIALTPSNGRLIASGLIRDMFPILRGTIFENGNIDAAFTYTWTNYESAVLFKGNTFCHLNFLKTNSIKDQKKWGPYAIKEKKPALGSILPRQNLNANISGN